MINFYLKIILYYFAITWKVILKKSISNAKYFRKYN